MAWTALSYAPNSLLTSLKMSQLQANFEAMAQAQSGSPAISIEALTLNSTVPSNHITVPSIAIGTSPIGAGIYLINPVANLTVEQQNADGFGGYATAIASGDWGVLFVKAGGAPARWNNSSLVIISTQRIHILAQ